MKPARRDARPARPAAAAPPAARLVAVIDIGATAIRMEIAALSPDGRRRMVDSLSQPVRLGKDTFTRGMLQRETIEECVQILRNYRHVLREHGIAEPSQIRAVATSAVQEAANRDAFLDRVYVATGIPVDCIGEVELSRLTYLAVRDLLIREAVPRPWDMWVVEVGGGSTETLLLRRDHVVFAESYRLGSLRLRETLETYRAPAQRIRAMLTADIRRTVDQMRLALPVRKVGTLMAMSGDARFAASRIVPAWVDMNMAAVTPRQLLEFTDTLFRQTVDDIVRAHRIGYPEAETLGPALLAYCEMARAFGVRRILVPKIHLRTALEIEMATRSLWTPEFMEQIRHAALALADKYQVEPRHSRHVAWLCGELFRATQAEHQLGPREAFLLETAALLHEVGLMISNRSHHKHSFYLIQNSELFGLTPDDLLIVALVARYHRRSPPDPIHPFYGALPRERRLLVQKLAALLRVADALDRSHTQRVRDLQIRRDRDRLAIQVGGVEDLTIERLALREKGDVFTDIFGLTPFLLKGSPVRGPDSNV